MSHPTPRTGFRRLTFEEAYQALRDRSYLLVSMDHPQIGKPRRWYYMTDWLTQRGPYETWAEAATAALGRTIEPYATPQELAAVIIAVGSARRELLAYQQDGEGHPYSPEHALLTERLEEAVTALDATYRRLVDNA